VSIIPASDAWPVRLPSDALQIWATTAGTPTPGRQAKHDLADQVNRLINATVMLDIGDLDDTDVTGLRQLIASTQAIVDDLRAMPALAHSQAAAGGDDARLLERSGITGRSNPLAAPLHLAVDGDRVRGWAEYAAQYEGPPGCLHGGFIAAAFDDLLGVAQMLSGSAGFTGTLTVAMRRPTPLARRIDYEAGVRGTEGRKILVWGTASCNGEVLAEAEGTFITPSAERAEAIRADLAAHEANPPETAAG